MTKEYDSPLDPGIARAVEVLNSVNVETYESCQGGEGHCYPEPTVRFHGDYSEGFRALAVALQHKLPVMALRRTWIVTHGEPVGPVWEMTFEDRDQFAKRMHGIEGREKMPADCIGETVEESDVG